MDCQFRQASNSYSYSVKRYSYSIGRSRSRHERLAPLRIQPVHSLWEDWNKVMRVEIPAHQVKKGSEAGSWHDSNDSWTIQGGRLYSTCLSLYMLEVYYRHLPLYNSIYAK